MLRYDECSAFSLSPLLKTLYHGEMAEWSNAAVLKTVDGQLSGGSNPSLSASNSPKRTPQELFWAFLWSIEIMSWFNYYGLILMAIIMIPNIIYAAKHKNNENSYRNKTVEILEQIGRYGCFVLMIFNIPYTYFNFWFDNALTVYLSVNGGLCLAYLIFWIICWNRNDKLKALSLSIIPSCIFIFSGIVTANIPLIFFSVIFAVCHIYLSCKNF